MTKPRVKPVFPRNGITAMQQAIPSLSAHLVPPVFLTLHHLVRRFSAQVTQTSFAVQQHSSILTPAR
jgi:hypothetical protein